MLNNTHCGSISFIACDLDGKYVVATAAPLIAVCSALVSHKWLYNRADDQELGELVDLTPVQMIPKELTMGDIQASDKRKGPKGDIMVI